MTVLVGLSAVVAGVLLLGWGCEPGAEVVLPPANAGFDYQLGAAYPPGDDVGVVVRDRSAPPPAGRYGICYVNGFQTQPDERDRWLADEPDLVLRDGDGEPVADPEWPDELVLDISTAGKRARLAAIVGEWIDGCAALGHRAVEVDNLDTFTRFEALAEEDAVAYAKLLTDRAHGAGLAVAQKNTAELLARRDEIGFDVAIVEECNEDVDADRSGCEPFVDVYGDRVYLVEYRREAFEAGCARHPELSIVLRDLALSAPGSPGYVRDSC